MIEFLVDRKLRIALARYSAELSRQNLNRLDAMSAEFVAREGSMDVIIDFRDVPSVAFPTSVIIERGRAQRRMSTGRRVFIVKDDLFFGMIRLYGVYQEGQGHDAPEIARSLEEALALLNATGATFEPV